MHQSLADEHGQMSLEEGEHGGPAPSWRHLFPSPPRPFQPASPQAAGLRQQPAVPPHIPSSCCPPATSTSHRHGQLHQWESSQGSLVYSKKQKWSMYHQKWSMCHLCKQAGAPQCRKHTGVKPLREEGTTCPAPQPCRGSGRSCVPCNTCFRCT